MSSPIAYRFRTAILHGPWRNCPREAERDAIQARQARADEQGLKWRVPGVIERRDVDPAS